MCDFEHPDPCVWYNDVPFDVFDWADVRGKTMDQELGPLIDSTTSTDKGNAIFVQCQKCILGSGQTLLCVCYLLLLLIQCTVHVSHLHVGLGRCLIESLLPSRFDSFLFIHFTANLWCFKLMKLIVN